MEGFVWRHFEGRDKEGNRFAHHALIHGSGRIFAKVYVPCSEYGEYNFAVSYFYGGPEGEVLDKGPGTAQFIDLESALRFCEATVSEPKLMDIANGVAVKVAQKTTA